MDHLGLLLSDSEDEYPEPAKPAPGPEAAPSLGLKGSISSQPITPQEPLLDLALEEDTEFADRVTDLCTPCYGYTSQAGHLFSGVASPRGCYTLSHPTTAAQATRYHS